MSRHNYAIIILSSSSSRLLASRPADCTSVGESRARSRERNQITEHTMSPFPRRRQPTVRRPTTTLPAAGELEARPTDSLPANGLMQSRTAKQQSADNNYLHRKFERVNDTASSFRLVT